MNPQLIDVNISLGRWPFRRLRGDDTSELVTLLQHHGITRAWAGTYDALLHKDIGGANKTLAHECRLYGRGVLVPFGAVNPSLPDWEEDIRRCAEDHKMPGIRLHPNYHSYKLDDAKFDQLLTLAEQHRLIVQIAVGMEDVRSHPKLLQVPDVDLAPLPAVLKKHPTVQIILLNSGHALAAEKKSDLESMPNVYFDIATIEGLGGVAKALQKISHKQLLFGTSAPFYYIESSMYKLQESTLSETQLQSIRHENAASLHS